MQTVVKYGSGFVRRFGGGLFVAALLLAMVSNVHATAVIDPDIDNAITTASLALTAVKVLALAIISFAIGRRIVLKFAK